MHRQLNLTDLLTELTVHAISSLTMYHSVNHTCHSALDSSCHIQLNKGKSEDVRMFVSYLYKCFLGVRNNRRLKIHKIYSAV